MNEKQRQKLREQNKLYPITTSNGKISEATQRGKSRTRSEDRRTTDSTRTIGQATDSWYSALLPREGDSIQQQIITSKICSSQDLLN